jgi:hypothetical protein
MEQTLFWLQDSMAKIISQCKEFINVQLYDHATSCLQIVASKIQALHVNRANESMHLGMVLNHMDNGLGNLVNHLKN